MGDIYDMLAEESSEVIKESMKLARFGTSRIHDDGLTNRDHLIQEIGDFMAVVGMMVDDLKVITKEEIIAATEKKCIKLHEDYHKDENENRTEAA